jgi:hypothetical protein
MLTRAKTILVLAFCLALISDSAHSQRRPRQEPIGSPNTPTTQPAAADQRGTDQVPFTIKILPSQDAKEKSDKADQERQEKTKIDEKIAFETQRIADYTNWLALFTGFLFLVAVLQAAFFWWQLREMGRAGIATRRAAEAAEKSAETAQQQIALARNEFFATHRPRIRVKHLLITNDIWQGEPIIVDLWCINTGTGIAIMNQAGIRYHVVRNDHALPIEPRIHGSLILGQTQLQTGLNYEIPNINIGRILTPQENADIQQGRSKLYCVGFISYLDGATPPRLRITGFCRVLKFPLNTTARVDNTRFRRFRDPDYEYED